MTKPTRRRSLENYSKWQIVIEIHFKGKGIIMGIFTDLVEDRNCL